MGNQFHSHSLMCLDHFSEWVCVLFSPLLGFSNTISYLPIKKKEKKTNGYENKIFISKETKFHSL